MQTQMQINDDAVDDGLKPGFKAPMSKESESDIFYAIAGGLKKTEDQTKKDLNYGHLLSDLRVKQREEEEDEKKRAREAGGKTDATATPKRSTEKIFHVAGVTVSSADAKAAENSFNPPIGGTAAAIEDEVGRAELSKPKNEAERKALSRAAFEKRFGLDFDEAIDSLISSEKREKARAEGMLVDGPVLPNGPSEGRMHLPPPEGLVSAARVWHPELFEPDDDDGEEKKRLADEASRAAAAAAAAAKKKKKKKKRKLLSTGLASAEVEGGSEGKDTNALEDSNNNKADSSGQQQVVRSLEVASFALEEVLLRATEEASRRLVAKLKNVVLASAAASSMAAAAANPTGGGGGSADTNNNNNGDESGGGSGGGGGGSGPESAATTTGDDDDVGEGDSKSSWSSRTKAKNRAAKKEAAKAAAVAVRAAAVAEAEARGEWHLGWLSKRMRRRWRAGSMNELSNDDNSNDDDNDGGDGGGGGMVLSVVGNGFEPVSARTLRVQRQLYDEAQAEKVAKATAAKEAAEAAKAAAATMRGQKPAAEPQPQPITTTTAAGATGAGGSVAANGGVGAEDSTTTIATAVPKEQQKQQLAAMGGGFLDWSCLSGSLCRLELGCNGLTGPLPPQLSSLKSLKSLLMPHNAFTGPLLDCFGGGGGGGGPGEGGGQKKKKRRAMPKLLEVSVYVCAFRLMPPSFPCSSSTRNFLFSLSRLTTSLIQPPFLI
jgi:hypothetical protein